MNAKKVAEKKTAKKMPTYDAPLTPTNIPTSILDHYAKTYGVGAAKKDTTATLVKKDGTLDKAAAAQTAKRLADECADVAVAKKPVVQPAKPAKPAKPATKKQEPKLAIAPSELEKTKKAAKRAANKIVKELASKVPTAPLAKALERAGFTYVQTQPVDDTTSAHGYSHPDGSAAMFIHHNTSANIGASWKLVQNGKTVQGKTAQELAVALAARKQTVPQPSTAVKEALNLLSKATHGTFRIADLTGDDNYTVRVQLLKKLRNTDKVLAKESGVNNLIKEFYAALDIPEGTIAAREKHFTAHCIEIRKHTARVQRTVKRVEKDELKHIRRVTAQPVLDGKPILPVAPRIRERDRKKQEAADKAAVLARAAREERDAVTHPIAQPRPDAKVDVTLDEICLIEDPNNGIVMLRLEKPNSQGAICVYNNGSRVAAGVVPTETLKTLRTLQTTDLVRDVNQLLHPLNHEVVVTPAAERHLTAVLAHCKETIPMAAEIKKFAAPKNGKPAKSAAKTAAKAPAKKAEKAEKAARTTEDRKIVALVSLKDKDKLPREGTFCYAQTEAALKSKTVSEAQAKLDASGLNPNKRRIEIAWLTKQKYIKIAA